MLKLVQKIEIQCNKCRRIFRIDPEELAFQISYSNRPMGEDITYHCRDSFRCQCGNIIDYDIQGTEYPVGAYDFDTSDCFGGKFIREPIWEVEYEPDFEAYSVRDIRYYMDRIKQMNHREFEFFVRDICENSGFETAEVTQQTRDGGYDILCRASYPISFSAIVECKHYNNTVGEPIIRNAYGVLEHNRDINAVIVATSSKFSMQARMFSEEHGDRIKLWDGEKLAQMYMDMESNR